MFSLASGIYQTYFAPPALNILIVGGSGVGKTTLLERCKVTQFSTSSKKPPKNQQQQSSASLQQFFLNNQNQSKSKSSGAPKTAGGGPASSVEAVAVKSVADRGNSGSSGDMIHHVKRPSRKHRGQLTKRNKQGSASSSKGGGADGQGGGNINDSLKKKNQKKSSWLCPAPPKYDDTVGDEEQDEVYVPIPQPTHPAKRKTSNPLLANGPIPGSPQPRRSTALDSLEDIDLQELIDIDNADNKYNSGTESDYDYDTDDVSLRSSKEESRANTVENVMMMSRGPSTNEDGHSSSGRDNGVDNDLLQQHQYQYHNHTNQQQQYDLKKGCRMISLDKIRPTIGMNLGKGLKICGATCTFMDVSGKFSTNLWEKYYDDCHGIIFVWKVECYPNEDEDAAAAKTKGEDDDDDNDSDDGRPPVTAKLQLSLLEQVRSHIPDDVPFLIVASTSSSNDEYHNHNNIIQMDLLYDTNALLPHYHNNYQGMVFVNAVNGHGVKTALEWLIPLASRYHDQQRNSAMMMMSSQQQQQQPYPSS